MSAPHQSIGHYLLTTKLGEGGMGQVWRATDTKLGRDVAIKILPDAFAADPDRLARFEREAQVLASLNHPNIAHIYGVENRALVMELIDGETLHGPLPEDTAIQYALQIAAALEAAHEKNIVHRDLKPGNIMVTAAGLVKVLDFGLARVAEPAAPSDPSLSPTVTFSPTRTGIILGTAAYMAPEQARGKAVDKRADIWAFGCVLYELLTGKQAFAGETASDLIAAIMKEEPDLSLVPARLRPILARCLRKDPRTRWRDIGDVRLALEEAPAEIVAPAATAPAPRLALLPWIVAAVLLLAAAGLGFALWRASRPVLRPLVSLSADLGPEAVAGRDTTIALSRDGSRMVFPVRRAAGEPALAVRFLNGSNSIVLPGTEGAINPFFSPDGESVAFFAGGKLKKVSIRGGSPMTLCDALAGRGGAWTADGFIIAALGTRTGLSRIPEQGGAPQPLTNITGEFESHRWPQILPGDETLLFTSTPVQTEYANATVEALSLKTGRRRTLQKNAFFGRYLAGGVLLFMREETLHAVPFDPATLETHGAPAPVLEDVAGRAFGSGQFDSALDGTLVYLRGHFRGADWRFSWLGRDATVTPLLSTPGAYFSPALSPDGKRIVLTIGRGKSDLWVYDLERNTPTRVTFSEDVTLPAWSPDGQHLVYASQRQGHPAILWTRADGAGEPRVLLEAKEHPCCFADGGRRLLVNQPDPTLSFIATVPLDLSDPDHPKAGAVEKLLTVPALLTFPAISPDGRWLAYVSAEGRAGDIFVRPFDGKSIGVGKWQISTGGASRPRWSRTGHQLLYTTRTTSQSIDAPGQIMVVDYTAEGGAFHAGNPRPWLRRPPASPGTGSLLEIAPDPDRVLIQESAEPIATSQGNLHATFLLNFADELRRRFRQ